MILIIDTLGVVCQFFGVKTINIAGFALLGLSVFWALASFISTLTYYTCQQERFENLRARIKKVKIMKLSFDKLTIELKLYLSEKFPELEKELWSKFCNAPTDASIIMSYPEIKSHKVIMELVGQIRSISMQLRDAEIDVADQCGSIRYHHTSKWEYFTPAIPQDLQQIVYDY